MRSTFDSSIRNFGIGLLALLVSVAGANAQRSQPPDRGGDRGDRGEPAGRGEPGSRGGNFHAPVEHAPVMVDRAEHGSIRHVDTHVVEHPAPIHHDGGGHNPGNGHRDVEVDFHRSQYWHGFVYGARWHALRVGYRRIFVNNLPYYYDDGIYLQQVGEDYQEVYPPVGAVIPELPEGVIEISTAGGEYYYVAGAFYVQQGGGFVIAPPPLGVVVPELPPGAVQVAVNRTVAYQFNGIYYQPVFVNGVTQYMTFLP